MAFMTPTSTPATPSRLVSKLCLVGESAVHPSPPANRYATTTATTSTRPLPGVAAAELDDQTPGAVFQLFAKVSVPLLPGSRCYPLFPDTNIHLRSSQVAALTPSSHLPISPTTHPLLATAASRLHIQTITGAASSAASSRQRAGQQQPAVQVAVQDFAVCLLVDGGDGTGGGLSGSNSSTASNVPPSAFTSASSRRLSTSSSRRLSTGHDDASTSFYIVVLELFVPCATIPPLDCYSVSLPLPRCLSNTLVFRISDADDEDATAEEDEEDWEISTTPRALSSRGRASVGPEDLDGTEENDDDVAMIEGTFQSTPAIEIRWGRAPPPLPPTNVGRSTTTTGRSRLVTLHEARSTLALQLLPSTKENNNGSSTAADVALDFTSYGSIHYPLVEATGYLELQLDLPLAQSFEWLPSSSFSGDDGSPTITTSTGLVHWDFLDSSPPLVESSSTQPPSTPGHPRQQSPSISATPSPPPQPSRHPSSSSSSLLRARLPSALLNANPSGPETSFAFDSAGVLGSPSSSLGGAGGDGGSPTAGRGPRHSGEEGARRKTVAARNMRVSLDLHKVRENRQQATDSTSWWVRVQGVVRLHRRCEDEDGEEGYALPLIALPGGGGSPCRVTVVGVDGSEVAEAGWRVVVPEKTVSVVEEATTTKGKGSVSRSGSSTTTTIVDILTPSTSQLRDAENEGRSHYFLLRPPSPVVQTFPPALSVSSSSSFASSASLGPAPTPSVKAVRRKTHTRDLFDPPTPSSPIHGKTRRRSSILASPPLHQQNQPPALSSTLTMKPTADTFLPSRALSKVSLDVFLVPARALSSADTAIIKGRKDGGNDSDATPSMGWDQLSVLRVVLPPRHLQEGESDGEDDLEFAISLPQASTFALEPSHQLKALSASWDGKAVGCGVVDPLTDGEEEREEGEEEEGVKYVRVMGDGGGGGVVEVRWVLEHVGASGSKEEERQGLGVGIPSFAEGVLWQEVKVEVGEGHGLSLLSSSAPSRPSTSPSSTSSALQTTTHSLPPLHTPHLRVLVCPVAPLSTSDKDRSSSSIRGFFSVYNLPLILLAILIASMGAEVREFRTSLTQLATHLHGSTRLLTGAVGALERSVVEEVSRGILARLDEAPALAIAPAPLEAVVVTPSEAEAEAPTAVVRDERDGGGGETEPHVDSIPEEIDTDSPILRPSFSSLPYNPPPPPPPRILTHHQPPPWRTGAGEMQQVHSSHGTDERLVEAFRTAMRALEPLVRVVGKAMEVVGRVWGWVVW